MSGAIIGGDFIGADFPGGADLRGVTIKNNADFRGMTAVDLRGAFVKGTAYFGNQTLDPEMLEGARFGRIARQSAGEMPVFENADGLKPLVVTVSRDAKGEYFTFG